MKASVFGLTISGASSIGQCPTPVNSLIRELNALVQYCLDAEFLSVRNGINNRAC